MGTHRKTDQTAEGLVLYIDNTRELYMLRQAVFQHLALMLDARYTSIIKMRRGTMCHFADLLRTASRQFVKEAGGDPNRWEATFPLRLHREAARIYRDRFFGAGGWYALDWPHIKADNAKKAREAIALLRDIGASG